MRKKLSHGKTRVIGTMLGIMCTVASVNVIQAYPVRDFYAATSTGEYFGLYNALQDKDMVVIYAFDQTSSDYYKAMDYLNDAVSGYRSSVAVLGLCTEEGLSDLQDLSNMMRWSFPLADRFGIGDNDWLSSLVPGTTALIGHDGEVLYQTIFAVGDAEDYETLLLRYGAVPDDPDIPVRSQSYSTLGMVDGWTYDSFSYDEQDYGATLFDGYDMQEDYEMPDSITLPDYETEESNDEVLISEEPVERYVRTAPRNDHTETVGFMATKYKNANKDNPLGFKKGEVCIVNRIWDKAGGYLALRSEATDDESNIIAKIRNGSQVIISERCLGEYAWVFDPASGKEGYVNAYFLDHAYDTNQYTNQEGKQ